MAYFSLRALAFLGAFHGGLDADLDLSTIGFHSLLTAFSLRLNEVFLFSLGKLMVVPKMLETFFVFFLPN